ncbi:MAG: FmdE family protein [Chloroflexota bacterium]
MDSLSEMLQLSAARHSHLCPRQVLGVRMGIAGLAALGIHPPVSKPTGLIIVETDGCFVDGIEVSTGATIGHRTLRVADLGKIAATFVDVGGGKAIRLAPQDGVRSLASAYAPRVDERYAAQLEGYQAMPDSELFQLQAVALDPPLAALLSSPDARATCCLCNEEIINERELVRDGAAICRSCAGQGYYTARRTVSQVGDATSRAASHS